VAVNDDDLLDDLVRAGRAEVASRARVTRLRRRVLAGLSAGVATTVAGGSASASIAGATAVWLKIGAIGAVLAVAGGGTAAVIATRTEPEPVVQAPAEPSAVPPLDPVETAPIEVPPIDPEPVIEPPVERAPVRVEPPPEEPPRESIIEPRIEPSLGVLLLRRARERLPNDPSGALSLVEEHQRTYGVFLAQEREVLRIDALSRLGRGDEATERARSFVERHPESVYRARVETLGGLDRP
jgi:hypothetical protein